MIKSKLSELVSRHPRYGFQKYFDLLRLNGCKWNHKRVYRIYCELGLNIRKKDKKRLPSREAKPIIIPMEINQSWSIDFMSDALVTGRKIRTLNVIDDSNREVLDIIASHSLPALRVTRELDKIGELRGFPRQIRVDNGPEFISKEFSGWAKKRGIHIHHIQPGKPAQNALIERFNRSFREEVLDLYLFDSVSDLQNRADEWVKHYNQERPHESLNHQPPARFFSSRGYTPLMRKEEEVLIC